MYTPQVEQIKKSGGKMYVTVGYIPTFTNSTFVFSAATDPTKYMDYVFEKESRNWYLTSLQESELKPVTAVSSTVVNDQNAADVDYDPAAVLQESINSETVASGVETPATSDDTSSQESSDSQASSDGDAEG